MKGIGMAFVLRVGKKLLPNDDSSYDYYEEKKRGVRCVRRKKVHTLFTSLSCRYTCADGN